MNPVQYGLHLIRSHHFQFNQKGQVPGNFIFSRCQQFFCVFRLPWFEIKDCYLMSGIGKNLGDPPAHTASAKSDDIGHVVFPSDACQPKPFCNKFCHSARLRSPSPSEANVRPLA